MTKAELMKEFKELEEEKRVYIDGIYWNSKKSEIENAIECLKCPDELLEKYLIVLSLKYENTGRTIANNGDFKHHSYNRLYVFNTARQILRNQTTAAEDYRRITAGGFFCVRIFIFISSICLAYFFNTAIFMRAWYFYPMRAMRALCVHFK